MPEELEPFQLDPRAAPDEVAERLEHSFRMLAAEGGYQGSVETFVPGVGETFGVRVPQLRELARRICSACLKQPDRVIAISKACWTRGSREHRLIALFILARARGLSPGHRWALGADFLPDVGDWETCDQLCSALLGPALAGEPSYMDALETWAGDGNFWVRRAAVVTTVSLRRSKLERQQLLTLNRRTLGLCERLLDDPQAYIRKAVDWGLRELIKRDYGLGKDFMLEKAAQRPGYPARATLKLAAKKMKDADRKRFLVLLDEASA